MPGFDWTEIAKYGSRARADLSASVTHWTKRQGKEAAFDVIKKILRERRIKASTSEGGYIKGNQQATCFSETPVTVMMRLFRLAENDRKVRLFLKWEPYGLSFWKPVLYQQFGGRPVLYLSDGEYRQIVTANTLEESVAWRVVRFDYENPEEAVDFTHEREWRTPTDVVFDTLEKDYRPLAVVSKTTERDDLLSEFPPGDQCPFRGVLCLGDLRALG